jgi:hypothetical protein
MKINRHRVYSSGLFVWPLIVMGGRLVVRMALNLWNMLEP